MIFVIYKVYLYIYLTGGSLVKVAYCSKIHRRTSLVRDHVSSNIDSYIIAVNYLIYPIEIDKLYKIISLNFKQLFANLTIKTVLLITATGYNVKSYFSNDTSIYFELNSAD